MIKPSVLSLKTLTGSALLSTLLVMTMGCEQQSGPGSKAGPPPSQGWTSGGGNATASRLATTEEIRAAVLKARAWLPFVYNAIGFDTISMQKDPVQPAGDNYNKLFGTSFGTAPIQAALKKMTVRIEEEKPCVSPLGEEDGAAYSDGSICISLARLQGKLSADTVFLEVTSLMGREASHLVGLGEQEADLIQKKIKATVHEELRDLAGPQSLVDSFSSPSWMSFAAWHTANSINSGESEGAICSALAEVVAQERVFVDGFMQAAAKFGAWPISSVDYGYYSEVLWFKSRVIHTQYCGGNAYDTDAVRRVFEKNPRQTIEVADLDWMKGNTYHTIYDDARHRPMMDVFVQMIKPGDHAALLKELNDLKAIADQMDSDIRKSSPLSPKS